MLLSEMDKLNTFRLNAAANRPENKSRCKYMGQKWSCISNTVLFVLYTFGVWQRCRLTVRRSNGIRRCTKIKSRQRSPCPIRDAHRVCRTWYVSSTQFFHVLLVLFHRQQLSERVKKKRIESYGRVFLNLDALWK